MSEIRIGIIGGGNFARARGKRFKSTEGCRVTLGWSRSEGSRERFRREIGAPAAENWRTVCESDQVDAVVISTPNIFHSEQVRASLANGKHVLVETPLCLHYSEAQQLAEFAAPRNLVIHHGAEFRYHPDHPREIENLHRVGMLVYAEKISTFDGGPERPWYREFSMSGGGFAFLPYEAVDLFEAFGPAETVGGKHIRRGKLDIATMLVRFAEGGQAGIAYGLGEDVAGEKAGTVIGSEGTVQWGMGLPKRLLRGEDIVELPKPRDVDVLLAECQAFVDEIRGERDFRPNLELDLHILKAVSEAQDRAK